MKPQICVSTLPKTIAQALAAVEAAEENGADFVEIRLDNLQTLDGLPDIVACGKLPKIATDKNADLTPEQWQKRLFAAAKAGFDYVDVELSTPEPAETVKQLKTLGAKCIVSSHNNHASFPVNQLNSILEKQLLAGADVCKIVTTATHTNDNLELLQFTSEASKNAKVVCFAMGELGKISRLLSPVFGGYFTFAALEGGSQTAPGQMSLQEMRSAYCLLGL
ncbi:MAG: type I 3-dehydroquinate dehydratase [Candidatus Bathyarchaeota archaeon]|nr:type I 3-dehydroquinate dehydratase [Candidatus Bathyarchaeota archaeon]